MSYQLTATEYSSTTDPDPPLFGTPPGGQIDDGRYRAQTYGITTTLTPFRRFYFSGTFTYTHSLAVTAANGDPSVVPYRGDIYTFTGTAAYALNPKTSLQGSYSFSVRRLRTEQRPEPVCRSVLISPITSCLWA